MTGQEWRGVRTLVTGARGFIGTGLCRRLIGAGATVHGVSSRPLIDRHSGVSWSQIDLTDPDAIRRLITRIEPDVVFHLAGRVTGSADLSCVGPTLAMNLVSTVHLLTVAAESRRGRVVIAGSMHEPDLDDATAVPCSPYAASKWACSAYARLFHSLYETPVVTARLFMVYGPGQWDVEKLVPYVTLSLLSCESPDVSSGDRQFDWVFIDDAVDGLMAVASASGVDGRSIDIGTGTLTSIREIVEHLSALVGTGIPVNFGARPDRPLERTRAARTGDTMRLIGWNATTPVAEGLRRTVAHYRDTCYSAKPA